MSLQGNKILNIRLDERLGAGGMGEVYLGRDERLDRDVAVKVLRTDLTDPLTKARILREARALSQLDHPNVCAIYDYIEGDKQDFLILERLHGETLAQLLVSGRLPADRLRIAEAIAEALVAAHEKGIIHRDLKPANVMIAPDGTVKVLDFGLARRVNDPLAEPGAGSGPPPPTEPLHPVSREHLRAHEETLDERASGPRKDSSDPYHTQLGHLVGTVSWMSPEQARSEPIGSASDLYTFGLLLQELMTGQPAYPPNLSLQALLLKVAAGETQPVAGLDPELTRLIESLKALAPSARPSAAETLARLRSLRAKPRRRLRRVVAAVVAATLLAVACKYTYDLRRERNAARMAQRDSELARAQGQEVVDFLVDLFKVSNPGESLGRTLSARERLDRGAAKAEKELSGQPLVQARLLDTIGVIYQQLGLLDQAAPLFEKGLAIREKESGGRDDADLATSLFHLGNLYREKQRAEAEPLLERSIAMREKVLGAAHPDVGEPLNALGAFYGSRGRMADAEPLFRRALAIREKALGAWDPQVAAALNNLAFVLTSEGKPAEAEPLLRRGLAIREKTLPPDHPDLAANLEGLAVLSDRLERYPEARRLHERALAIWSRSLGPEHPQMALVKSNLAGTLVALGEHAAAERLLQEALALRMKLLGPEHPDLSWTLVGLGDLFAKEGKLGDSEAAYRRSLALLEKSKATTYESYPSSVEGLARVLRAQGRAREAEEVEARLPAPSTNP